MEKEKARDCETLTDGSFAALVWRLQQECGMSGDVTCQMYLGQKVMLGYCRVPESSSLSCAEINSRAVIELWSYGPYGMVKRTLDCFFQR